MNPETSPPKDWRFYARYIGLGLVTASIIYYVINFVLK
jgi:hypothetical protein